MAATNSPVTNNAAMSGCLGGMASGRQPILDAEGDVMQPSDFTTQVVASADYATEEQVALGASFAEIDGGTLPTYFTGMGTGAVTATASTASHTVANAFESLPAAMMILAMASFDNQPPPPPQGSTLAEEAYFAAQANAVSSVFANAVVQSGPNTGPLFCTD